MATEEIEISQLELADEILADMVAPVETATETKAVTLSKLRKWLGSSLPTGFILPAVGRIEDSRFTLLDGKTLSRAGTYEAFCNKVIEQVNAGNWFSCTQSEYDEDLSNYGQCGRFVIETDYVRIPTITRYIGATITLSEIGKSYGESLPNIRGRLRYEKNGYGTAIEASGALSTENGSGNAEAGGQAGSGENATIILNANNSSSTYQDGAKVNPENTKYPYYMVISTEGQTEEVEIDINNIYEDLNLKANKDLSDVSQAGKKTVVDWGMPSDNYVDLTLSSGSHTAPASGYIYAEMDSATYIKITVGGGGLTFNNNRSSAGALSVTAVVRKGQSYTIVGTKTALRQHRFVYAEGEI